MSGKAPATRPYQMRARAAGRDRTHQAIAAAAWERFACEPYVQVTLAAVAAGAGVSVRTLLNQFGSKEDLFVAAYERVASGAAPNWEDLRPGDTRAAVRELCAAYEERGDAVLLLLSQEQSIPAVRAMTERGRERHRRMVERLAQEHLRHVGPTARARRLAQLVALTDVHFWSLLRRSGGLSREQTEVAIEEALTSLTQAG